MTALDVKIAALALSLIDRLGKGATIYDKYASVDVATGRTSETPDSWTVKVSPPSPVSTKYVDGTIVQASDTAMLIARSGLAFTPVVGMRVEYDSQKFTLVSVQPIYSGELIAAWRLIGRK